MASPFKLTYSTMFDPPAELHARFDDALMTVRSYLGGEHPMLIDGHDERATRQFDARNPADTRIVLGRFQAGSNIRAWLLCIMRNIWISDHRRRAVVVCPDIRSLANGRSVSAVRPSSS